MKKLIRNAVKRLRAGEVRPPAYFMLCQQPNGSKCVTKPACAVDPQSAAASNNLPGKVGTSALRGTDYLSM